MLANQFAVAVASAKTTPQLDSVARMLWKAHAEGAIADADAEAIAGAVQARRAAFARPATATVLSQAAPASARRKPIRPRSPDRQASLERRRRQAMSGIIPARIAASFTLGEVAALAVIARAVQQAGVCILPIDKIAALAGVCRTTAQNAVRAAERLRLLQRQERRRRGLPSDTNVLKVVSKEWLAWLQHGKPKGTGLKTLSTTDNYFFQKGKSRVTNWRNAASHARVKREQAVGGDGSTLDEVLCSTKSKARLSASGI